MQWGSKKVNLNEKNLPGLKFRFIYDHIDFYLRSLKLKSTPKVNLLDFGCGNGKMIYSLQDYFSSNIDFYGCDIRNTKPYKFNFTKTKPLQALPYKDNMFDIILCIDVLEHIPNYKFYIEEMNRILKSNGKLIIFSPIEGEVLSFYSFYKMIFGEDLYATTKDHINPFKRRQFLLLFESKKLIMERKQYLYHFFGHFFDATFFLLHRISWVKNMFWNNNSFYKHIKKPSIATVLFNFFLVFFNFLAYCESKFLKNIPYFSAGLLVAFKKNPK